MRSCRELCLTWAGLIRLAARRPPETWNRSAGRPRPAIGFSAWTRPSPRSRISTNCAIDEASPSLVDLWSACHNFLGPLLRIPFRCVGPRGWRPIADVPPRRGFRGRRSVDCYSLWHRAVAKYGALLARLAEIGGPPDMPGAAIRFLLQASPRRNLLRFRLSARQACGLR